MANQQPNTSLRLLILTLNLLNTNVGISGRRLIELVPGYDGQDIESQVRKLERDLATLRETGLDVRVTEDRPPRYTIDLEEGPEKVVLSESEFKLLRLAAESWSGSVATQGAVVINKLRAVSPAGSGAAKPPTHLALEGGAFTPRLHDAIERSQPVAFEYQSRRGRERREVAPWNLVARGRALYLWGFDLNRWDARLFRLSRFRSAPELIAEQEATIPTGALKPREFDYTSFTVRPILAVRKGEAPLVRKKAHKNTETSDWDIPEGWDLLVGDRDDAAAWEASILREAESVVVLEPRFLAEGILESLSIASSWRSGDPSNG